MRMVFSRWKLLTAAFGLSAGGFATLGGTTPPAADSPLVVRAEEKLNVPPPPSVSPAVAVTPVLPTLPPALPVSAPSTPPVPVSSPVIELPGLPLPESKPTETKLPAPASKPVKPMDTPVVPVSAFTLPPSALPATDVIPPTNVPNATPPSPPTVPPSLPPMPKPARPIVAESTLPPTEFVAPSLPPMAKPTPVVDVAPTRPAASPIAQPNKFRILLRVGAGDPTFEVRHDDDLVMKVVCEKVDIKSPEKGQGPSNVVASGKVRFVGFGAEGTCDSFSFLAGTGEVSLTGNVNVKVRDKIGRVESELNADKMQYKLDPTALTGTLKP
jgi:hypothetical protein